MQFHPSTVRSALSSPWGPMTLAASDTALVGVWFDGQAHQPSSDAWPLAPKHPVLAAASSQLAQYFAGERTQFSVPLDVSGGTAFQQAVWTQLLDIPSGSTLSYGQLGLRVGNPRAVRAVGAAVGRNPISIIIPCHRVVGAQGALTGYAGGLDRKKALLALERNT